MERILTWLIVRAAPRVIVGVLVALLGILVDAGLLDGTVADAVRAALLAP